MKRRLVIISAPSGAGKTSVVKYLLSTDLNLEFSVSATTRPVRNGESNGKDYYFLSVEEFRRKIHENKFVEWEEVYDDHFYGTLKSELDRIWDSGKYVLFDVDVKGGINLKNIFGKDAVSIFIKPPSVEELEKRLKSRGTDSIEKIVMRVAKAEEEIGKEHQFDFVVVNDKLEDAQKECYSIINLFLSGKSEQ
jgi:guanylate kinase